ncbi:hypothetical protein [Nitrosopumilus sp.]|uniref:hypothetical protein n=1 Tax=Nitrosopumilus sp. TaxID=2024843 RepID=UPI00292E4DA2|nr:hypothetical protein [Nitrosopumilus sp.]
MRQQLLKINKSEKTMNLVGNTPAKKRAKISANQLPWEDIRGLTWAIMDADNI